MANSSWSPTGWKCATGHVIEMSLHLPAGVYARVHRKDSGHWQNEIRRGYRTKLKGRFKTRTAAMRACETELAIELKSALQMLGRLEIT